MRKVGLYRHLFFRKNNRTEIQSCENGQTKEEFLSSLDPMTNKKITTGEQIDYIKTIVLCEVEVNDSFEVKE